MTKLTKRMRIIHSKINFTEKYDIYDAITLLKTLPIVKFIESVDVAIKLEIDTRKSDQNIRGITVLPHGIGRDIRVAVFTQGENVVAAKNANADLVGMNDLAEQIKKKKFSLDIIIASPDAMALVGQLGQILGPRGLMPNPKFGTITLNIAQAVKKAKSGQIYYRNDKNGIVHTTIGKISFNENKLKENLESLLNVLKKNKPNQVKGIFIKKISLSTTMGIGVQINQQSLSI